jgi:hypothetical protein
MRQLSASMYGSGFFGLVCVCVCFNSVFATTLQETTETTWLICHCAACGPRLCPRPCVCPCHYLCLFSCGTDDQPFSSICICDICEQNGHATGLKHHLHCLVPCICTCSHRFCCRCIPCVDSGTTVHLYAKIAPRHDRSRFDHSAVSIWHRPPYHTQTAGQCGRRIRHGRRGSPCTGRGDSVVGRRRVAHRTSFGIEKSGKRERRNQKCVSYSRHSTTDCCFCWVGCDCRFGCSHCCRIRSSQCGTCACQHVYHCSVLG